MQAILLCGGLGSRLRSVVSDRPKPLADINGKAFMEYLTDELVRQGIRDIIFAAGFKGRMIEDYFASGESYGINASYAYEEEPLGTAGALRNSLPLIREDKVLIINADTFYKIDYHRLYSLFEENRLDMALYTREVADISRYGELRSRNNMLLGWNEKSEEHRPGEINGGIYLISRSLIEGIAPGKSSLENSEIPRWIAEGKKIGVIKSEGYFIDIGIPEAYKRFCEDAEKGRFNGI